MLFEPEKDEKISLNPYFVGAKKVCFVPLSCSINVIEAGKPNRNKVRYEMK